MTIDERRIETRLDCCPFCGVQVISQRDLDVGGGWIDYDLGTTRAGEVHVCKEDGTCGDTVSAG